MTALAGFAAGLGFFGAGALCAVLLFALCLWMMRRAGD